MSITSNVRNILKERGLWKLVVKQVPPVDDVPELTHVEINIINSMVRDFVLDRFGEEVARQVAERYIDDHYQELVAQLDTSALVKQLGVSIGTAIAETMVPRGKR